MTIQRKIQFEDKSATGAKTYSEPRQYVERRINMVANQLRTQGIDDERVLCAMLKVARHEFVPAALRDAAYEDGALPIGFGQTISQPFTVAYMLQAMELTGSENVLEIGAGSGYSAAVLSHLATFVHTIERVPELAAEAKERLASLGYWNVFVHQGDGSYGLPDYAPFDAIVVAAGAEELPSPLVEQLAEGGRLVIPIGSSAYSQNMIQFKKIAGRLVSKNLGRFVFVPLIEERH